jgi:hypothetical protein
MTFGFVEFFVQEFRIKQCVAKRPVLGDAASSPVNDFVLSEGAFLFGIAFFGRGND